MTAQTKFMRTSTCCSIKEKQAQFSYLNKMCFLQELTKTLKLKLEL